MLLDLQRRILEGLLAPGGAPEALELLSGDRALSPSQQLAVYRDSIDSTLLAALGEVYPVCRRLVGERFFTTAAMAFIRLAPSRSPDLNDYGEGFGAFLAGFPPAVALPYLPDVARLEWAWHRAFYGPDSDVIERDALAAAVAEADPERVVFRLAPTAALIESPFPIDLIWQANQPGSAAEEVVDVSTGGVQLLVWRSEQGRHIDPLAPPDWCLLHAVAQGLALGDVCVRVTSAHPAANVGSLLASAIRRGWLAGFDLS